MTDAMHIIHKFRNYYYNGSVALSIKFIKLLHHNKLINTHKLKYTQIIYTTSLLTIQ